MKLRKVPRPDPLPQHREWPQGCTWYGIVPEPRQEFTVAHALEAMGAFTWVPTREKAIYRDARNARRSWAKLSVKPPPERKRVEIPILSGIVFTAFAQPPRWLYVLQAKRVAGVIANNHEPVPILTAELVRFRDGLKIEQGRRQTGKTLRVGAKYRLNLKGLHDAREVEITELARDGRSAWIAGLFGMRTLVSADQLEEAA